MSDGEFENYLTLIGRLLRLSPAQREAIGEELRDHFESRLAELLDRGLAHDEAVRIAIEEFGDAAGLAASFSSISQTRRRRLIMRCTVASVAAMAAAVVVAMAVWPENHAGRVVGNAVAQTKEKNEAERSPPKTVDVLTAETEQKLNKLIAAEYVETPLKEVMTHLADVYKIQIYYNTPSLRDAAIDPSAIPVNAGFSNIRLGRFLEWTLAENNMGYAVRDGIIVIATKDWLDAQVETRVYDCRDILGSNSFSATMGAGGGYGGGADIGKEAAEKPKSAGDRFVNVISSNIAGTTWASVGGPGTVSVYDGLLVVSQTAQVQSQIVDLLDQMRAKLAVPSPKELPKPSPAKTFDFPLKGQ